MPVVKNTVSPVIKRKKIAGIDIALNVGFKDALIRFGAMILLPVLMLFIDKHLH